MAGRSFDTEDHIQKKPTKGILKTSSSFEKPESKPKKGRCKTKAQKWDEMNIIATLHPADKDYGHMKVEEPKTPFERMIQDDDDDETDGVDANLLAKKLEVASKSLPKSSRPRHDTGSGNESDISPEEREKRKQFQDKRKAHYNEYYAALVAKKLMEEEEDSDSDTNSSKSKGSGGGNDNERRKGKLH